MTSNEYFRGTGHALFYTSPNSKKPVVVELILFISITLHLLAPPPCRLRNLSSGRSFFCCRSTNSMYRPSGSQYFLVRICLPCHPHRPCVVPPPLAWKRERRTHSSYKESLFHLVFLSLVSCFIITAVGGDYWVDSLHWKYDDFPGPMRRLPLAMFYLISHRKLPN